MARIPVFGGPADGLVLPPRPLSYVWIDGAGRQSRDEREGAVLYRRTRDAYVFCGNRLRRCACGAFIERAAPQCRLCGRRV